MKFRTTRRRALRYEYFEFRRTKMAYFVIYRRKSWQFFLRLKNYDDHRWWNCDDTGDGTTKPELLSVDSAIMHHVHRHSHIMPRSVGRFYQNGGRDPRTDDFTLEEGGNETCVLQYLVVWDTPSKARVRRQQQPTNNNSATVASICVGNYAQQTERFANEFVKWDDNQQRRWTFYYHSCK